MSDGILIFLSKRDYAVLETNDGLVTSVLFPDFYKGSRVDLSKVFLLDIYSLIKTRGFGTLNRLANDIRRNYKA